MEKYFKIKYGFKSTDFVSVKEGGELEKSIYAMLKEQPVTLGGKMINGKHIISIEPDYHRYTGWNPEYQPSSSEDYAQIKRDCPEFEGVFDNFKSKVVRLLSTGQANLIGQNVDIKKLN